MSVNRHSLLIFDAACLVAAAGSPAGGSGLLVGLCVRGYFRGTASDLIVAEATRNARAKLGDLGATRLERALRSADLEPADATAIAQVRLINAKDRHVIAATLSSGAGFLITLGS